MAETTVGWMCKNSANATTRERAIQAAVIEMSLFTGNLEMKVRRAIERYEFVLQLAQSENQHDQE